MAHYNYFLLFIGDALTTLIFGLIVLARIPETQPTEASHAAHVSLKERARQIGREPILLIFSVLALFIGIIYMQGYVTLPIDIQAHGLTPADYGLAISVNGILIVLFSIQVSNAAGKWHRFGAMAVAALLLGAGYGLNAFAHNLPFYIFCVTIWTLGEITASAVAPALIADLSPVELRGLFQGIFGSAWGLAFFVGPIAGGWIYEHLGSSALWGGCLILGIMLAFCYLAMSAPAKRRMSQSHSSPTD